MPNHSQAAISALQAKEKQSYNALSAVIDFVQGQQRHTHEYKSSTDFDRYKRVTLMRVARLKLKGATMAGSNQENQFNVMHYQRAILTASQSNYRNMAILAAKHNLTAQALIKLVNLIKKSCIKLSKEIKLTERKLILEQSKHNQQNQSLAATRSHVIVIPSHLEIAS